MPAPDPKASNDTAAGPRAAAQADTAVRQALLEGREQLHRFLRGRLGNIDEAEEVLQAFMLRALERAADIRDVKTVRGWLSRVLRTAIADHQRRAARRRKREVEAAAEDLKGESVQSDAEMDEAICDCIYKLLPTLRPGYAELIQRVDLAEESREMVADSLRISLNNLNVRLHRARHDLKRRLEELCTICPVHGFLNCGCERARLGRGAPG